MKFITLLNKSIRNSSSSLLSSFNRRILSCSQDVNSKSVSNGIVPIRLFFCLILGRKHTNTRRQIIIDFHKTNRNQTVKPCICNFFNHIFKCFLITLIATFFCLNCFYKSISLFNFNTGDFRIILRTNIIKICITC